MIWFDIDSIGDVPIVIPFLLYLGFAVTTVLKSKMQPNLHFFGFRKAFSEAGPHQVSNLFTRLTRPESRR